MKIFIIFVYLAVIIEISQKCLARITPYFAMKKIIIFVYLPIQIFSQNYHGELERG